MRVRLCVCLPVRFCLSVVLLCPSVLVSLHYCISAILHIYISASAVFACLCLLYSVSHIGDRYFRRDPQLRLLLARHHGSDHLGRPLQQCYRCRLSAPGGPRTPTTTSVARSRKSCRSTVKHSGVVNRQPPRRPQQMLHTACAVCRHTRTYGASFPWHKVGMAEGADQRRAVE